VVARTLLLHIGTQKSGTTYLQRVLASLSGNLKRSGVLYPLRLAGRKSVYNHEAAAYGLLGTSSFPWVPEQRARAQEDSWAGLVRKVRDWDGTAIVSGEALSVISADAAARLIASLGVADTRVLITARDLGRVLPSSWQQHIRNGRSTSFASYLDQTARRRGSGDAATRVAAWEADPDQTFWRAYDIGTLAARWAPLAASVSVVTVPRRGAAPDELWWRFRDALGVADPAVTEALPTTPPPIDDSAANIGLTEPEVMVLAGLNRVTAGADPQQVRALRGQLARDVFRTRPDRGAPVRIPRAWLARVTEWAQEDVATLSATDSVVVGSIEDLRVEPGTAVSDGADVDEVARAAGDALAHLAGITRRT
jgi:hypothetical protein